jgi:N-acetylneuraminic acid mutarotase
MKGPASGAVLDAATLKWVEMPAAPVEPRFRGLTAVIGQKVLVWGGYPGGFQDGAAFDAAKGTWEKLPKAPVPFCTNMVSAVWRDRFVVFGGRAPGGQCHRAGAVYDPAARTWEKVKEVPIDVGVASACAVSGDRLFLWSGQAGPVAAAGRGESTPDGAVFNFATRRWESVPEAPLAPRQGALAHPAGTRIIVWGGWKSTPQGGGTFSRDCAVYDPGKDDWQAFPDFPGKVPYQLHPGW